MKLIAQLAFAIIASFAGSAIAVSCGSSGRTETSDVRLLRNDLASNGQNYRVSGQSLSQFDQVGSADLTMRRVSGIPTGSTHVEASAVGNIVQNIIDDCCGGQFCCGNDVRTFFPI
jgi:hypothetical protein